MKPTTIGNMLFERIVPEEFRADREGEGRQLTSARVQDILEQVAHKDPQSYREISHKLLRLGAKGSVETNTSFTLKDLESPIEKEEILRELQAKVDRIDSSETLTDEQKEKKKLDLYSDLGQRLPDKVFAEAMKRDSGLAKMVAAGARGSKGQLNSNIGADGAIFDAQGRQIPIPLLSNYAEGLSPAEYFAASYGTRLGLVATKFSVQDGGYFAKQLAAAASDLIITEDDCRTKQGLPVTVDDKSNIGGVLAENTAGFSRGTVITPKVARQIKAAGTNDIVVRSPISCTAKGGGICKQCAGIREKGNFPEIGENVGIAASNGVAEPVSQALLSTKHTAGVASAGGSGQVRGFPQIASLAEVPKTFPYAATLAGLDGKISKVEDAPQGGRYIFVDNERHYVPADRDVSVAVGDEVEAGDILSSGTPNPKEIVRHKGIGAGRAYFVEAMQKALKDNRTSADRRNLEIIGRALINHVRIGDDETNDQFMPDEIVEYSALSSSYKPAGDTQLLPAKKARGMYLQKPILHYSVGTRITPSVLNTLAKVGREEVEASPTKPSFEPEMIRINDNPAYKDDFMTHTGQAQVKRNLGRDVRMGGAESLTHGKYFAPALAKGTEFGRPLPGGVGY
jgi:DNA-directed RNA polymerase subunit beta'